MSEKNLTLEIDKPYFTIRLYQDMLKMDLKGSTKNAIEEALENKPVLRETIGGILSIFAPLHIRLSEVDMVKMDKTGKVKLILPRHRDIIIPLEPKEAKKLVDKLNELIPKEKEKKIEQQKNIERVVQKRKLEKMAEEEEAMARASIRSGGQYGTYGTLPPPASVSEEMKEAERETEEQED